MHQPDSVARDPLRLNSDVFCVGCGYNLRTLSLDAVCPECALPLRQSLLTGGQLAWLKKVRRGLTLLYCTAFVFALSAVLIAAVRITMPGANLFVFWSCFHYLGVPLGILFTIGTFRVTDSSPHWNNPKLRPLASATRIVSLLCMGGALVRIAYRLFWRHSPHLYLATHAPVYLLDLSYDWLLASFLFLMLAGLGLNLRNWWIFVLLFSGTAFAFSQTTLYIGYRTWLQYLSGVNPGPSSTRWMEGIYVLSLIAYVANNVLCMLYYRKCRSEVTRRIASNTHAAAADNPPIDPPIGTNPALLGPGQRPYNLPDETPSV